jgi:hypothetical protein
MSKSDVFCSKPERVLPHPDDFKLAERIALEGKSFAIVANKWDMVFRKKTNDFVIRTPAFSGLPILRTSSWRSGLRRRARRA